jgi:outer membrane receptor protein involved in Fe transport
VRGGLTYFNKEITATNNLVYPLSANFEGVDPKFQLTLQSMMDLPRNTYFDLTGRYVDALIANPPTPSTPAYFSLDARLAKEFDHIELSIVGQNLLAPEHVETGIYSIPRSAYVKLIARF